MNSKKRVWEALEHREPDRVPVGEFATDYPMIEAALGRPTFWRGKARMIKALWEGRRDEVVESQKRDIVEFTQKLGLDMVPVNLALSREASINVPRQVDDNTWEDEYGNILKYSEHTEDIGVVRQGSRSPSSAVELPETLESSELEIVEHVMKELGETHFIFARPGRAGVGYPSGLGLEEKYIRLAEDPDGYRRSGLEAAERLADNIRPFVEAGVDAIAIGTDFGFNSGPFMSPQTFRDVFFPIMKRQCEIIHTAGKPVLFHSCGNNRPILDMMVEAGMDCYQAIQPLEKIEEVKALYGDRIALWGGVSADSLCRAEPEEIECQTLFSLKHCAPGGGFILSSSHSVMVDARYENYETMLDVNRKWGRYPIRIAEVSDPEWGAV